MDYQGAVLCTSSISIIPRQSIKARAAEKGQKKKKVAEAKRSKMAIENGNL